MRSGPEIQAALRQFIGKWSTYAGSERGEAQTFLNDLFTCYGTDRKAVGARFEDFVSSAGFMDLHWPTICIVEMKAPTRGKKLHEAREQVMRYWLESSNPLNDQPAARWVVLCAFQRFEVWEPGRFPTEPRLSFDIEELPDRYEALQFLSGPTLEPIFVDHHRELTRDAAGKIAALYQSLKDRAAAPLDEIQRFTLQCVWTLFAEDLGMLHGYPLQHLVNTLRWDRTRSSAADIGHLFRVLNQKGNHNRKGVLSGTRYVNGDLFKQPAGVDLDAVELDLLSQAAEYDWQKVNPTIFGSLMEGVLGRERRWELGAHYTHEADIMKIVVPTIVRPWTERIEATTSPQQARNLLDNLVSYTVLDPACGCGNFLYIAYREIRALEHTLKERIYSLSVEKGFPLPSQPWPYYPLKNLAGIDVERVAVLIARITLWMGHRQMIDKYGEAEDPLPLVDLSGLRVADALRVSWPVTDCIIGNPPFLGSQHIRSARGGEYVEWLKGAFHVGVRDYCVYWFRRAHESLPTGGRAGLVGTNSISQNRGRDASLEYILDTGGVITDAVSTQKWPGEAKVHVSLVSWVKQPVTPPMTASLDGAVVDSIDASLRAGSESTWKPARIQANKSKCFQGPIPVGAGFIIPDETATTLLNRTDADYSKIIRPYLTASDITDDPQQRPSRWIIDFAQMPLEVAAKYPGALEIVKREVRDFRQTVNRANHRLRWWQFGEPRVKMRQALLPLSRYIAVAAHAKRVVLAWCEPRTLASNATMVFAFDDDYHMGVLQSKAHVAWAWSESSTIKGDIRYTPTSVFETFPWPEPTRDQRRLIASSCKSMLDRRDELCRTENIGLTALYNQIDDGAFTGLVRLQNRLDEAIAACYGWPKAQAQNSQFLVERLRAMNRDITEGGVRYRPFT